MAPTIAPDGDAGVEAGKALLSCHLEPPTSASGFGLAVEAAQAPLHPLVGDSDPVIAAQISANPSNPSGSAPALSVWTGLEQQI